MSNIDLMEAGATSPTCPEGYPQINIDDERSALYGAIGNLYNEMGDIPRAMDYYTKAGELFDKHGWNTSNSVLYYNIGETWLDEGDLKAAEKAYFKSLDYATAADDSLWIAISKKGLGRMYLDRGKKMKALDYLNQADEYLSEHDKEEAVSRKELFEYMSMALQKQKEDLIWLLVSLSLSVVLTLMLIALTRRLRKSRREQAEAADVMEEALEDLERSKKASASDAASISSREKEILDLLAKGYTTPQIAEALHLSPETVKWYRKKLLVKLDVSNTPELISLAKESGLL